MTIYTIKRNYMEAHPDSHFFDRDTLAFFGQTMASFKVVALSPGYYEVYAPIFDRDGHRRGDTYRIYSTKSAELYTQNEYESIMGVKL